MISLFTKHPRNEGETYFQHLKFAFPNGLLLMLGGMACIIHSVFPFLFTTVASVSVETFKKNLNLRLSNRLDNKRKHG